jgi:hypothetical protein
VPERFSTTFAGQPLYDATYERDALGRITHLTETIAGAHRLGSPREQSSTRSRASARPTATTSSATSSASTSRTAAAHGGVGLVEGVVTHLVATQLYQTRQVPVGQRVAPAAAWRRPRQGETGARKMAKIATFV